MTTNLNIALVENINQLTTAMSNLGSIEESHNMDGNMDGSGAIVNPNVLFPIRGWNSVARIDLPTGKWHLNGYCAFTSTYTDLALIGFGLSDSSGNGSQYPIIIPLIIGKNNNQDNSQPLRPTILQYIGRTFGSETLNSSAAGPCHSMVLSGPVTYYLNYAILDDTTENTFVGSELIINPLLVATRVGTI